MKINLTLTELVVPKSIEKKFKEEVSKEDRKYDDAFQDWFYESFLETVQEKITDQETAQFVVSMTTESVEDSSGGYPIENWMEFVADDGYRYHVCAYGWTGLCEDMKGDLDMIGYREKETEKEKR